MDKKEASFGPRFKAAKEVRYCDRDPPYMPPAIDPISSGVYVDDIDNRRPLGLPVHTFERKRVAVMLDAVDQLTVALKNLAAQVEALEHSIKNLDRDNDEQTNSSV